MPENPKEAIEVARGELAMMCWSCGSVVKPPEFRCDCTKAGMKCQRIVPVPDISTAQRGIDVTDDILFRLRDLSPGYGNIIKDAVEEIENLRAEVGRLKIAFRINMLRFGATDADIDRVLADRKSDR